MKRPIKFFAEMSEKTGRVNKQGVIYDIENGEGQYFSWIDGFLSDEFCFTEDYYKKLKLFDTDYDLRMFIEECNQ